MDEKEEDGNSSMDEDDVSLLAKKFSKFFLSSKRNKGTNFSRTKLKNDGDMGINKVIWYKCKKSGHIHQDCLLRKKKKDKNEKKFKKKVLAIIQNGSNDSSY